MPLPESVHTARVQLRTLRLEDADALCTAYGTGALEDADPCRTPDEARAAILTWARDFAAGDRLVYGIFSADVLVGTGVITPSDARAVNIGLWLAESARGAGVGTAAVSALTEIGVRCVGAERAELWCEPTNVAMMSVAARVGYTHVAALPQWRLRSDGTRRDVSMWRADATAWTPLDDVHLAMAPAPMSEADRVWALVTGHLRARYAIAVELPLFCELAVEVERADGVHVQSVLVHQSRVAGRPWLTLRAPVGNEQALSHHAALHHNTVLAAGALALEEGMFVLRYGLPPTSITVDGIDCLVRLLADEAVRLRAQTRATISHHSTAFADFAD